MDWWITYLQQHEIVLLLLIISLGFLFGRIRIFGFSLEASGILFVAMLFGHFGFTLNSDFQVLGLLLFIYAIGLQAGPSFLNMTKKHGKQLYLLVFILISIGALLTIGLTKILQIDSSLAIGLFAGAMTSTPGLAAAQEATHSALTSIGYGVAYPFGVIGVILFIKLLPYIFRVDLKQEENTFRKNQQQSSSKVIGKFVLITNSELDGKTLKELNFSKSIGAIVSRIMRTDKIIVPSADTILHQNDVVRLVGTEAKLESAIPYLGKITAEQNIESSHFESQRFVVTNKEIVDSTIADLNLPACYQANITRIRRGGMEFIAEPHHRLQWGDRIRVAGEAAHMNEIKRFFGDEMKKLETGDIFSILTGILVGIVFGLIPFSIGKIISFNFGLTGGVLLAGLILSNRGKVGPIIWQVPVPIINFMRDLGLTLFLAVVGIKSGAHVLEIIQAEGMKLLFAGVLLTILPMAIVAVIARIKYKVLLIELFGLLSGGMTSTPGLAVSTGMTSVQRPLVIYATVYPFAMILMMIWTKVLALF